MFERLGRLDQELRENAGKPEFAALTAGATAGGALFYYEVTGVFHVAAAQASSDTINSLHANIATAQSAETMFAGQPEAIQQHVDQVAANQISADNAQIHATVAHQAPYNALERAGIGLLGPVEMIVFGAVLALGTFRRRHGGRNSNPADKQANTQHASA